MYVTMWNSNYSIFYRMLQQRMAVYAVLNDENMINRADDKAFSA